MTTTGRFSRRRTRIGCAFLAVAAGQLVSCWLGIDFSFAGVAGDIGMLLPWAIGHCDTLDGPVVNLARKALQTGNVNHVLPWVRPEDESEIHRAFDHAVSVRKLGPDARELADAHFFETLVRVHRASEGAPYTGLKPAGLDLGPAVPAADKAIADGSVEAVVKLLTDAVRDGVRRNFHAVMHHSQFAVDDVAAARKYVEAYVRYVHYVEQLWRTAASGASDSHHSQAGAPRHAAHRH